MKVICIKNLNLINELYCFESGKTYDTQHSDGSFRVIDESGIVINMPKSYSHVYFEYLSYVRNKKLEELGMF